MRDGKSESLEEKQLADGWAQTLTGCKSEARIHTTGLAKLLELRQSQSRFQAPSEHQSQSKSQSDLPDHQLLSVLLAFGSGFDAQLG